MNEKQKIRAEFQEKFDQFDAALGKLKGKAAAERDDLPSVGGSRLQLIRDKMVSAERKFNDLMTVPEEQMASRQTDLVLTLDDIDQDIQRAMAHYS